MSTDTVTESPAAARSANRTGCGRARRIAGLALVIALFSGASGRAEPAFEPLTVQTAKGPQSFRVEVVDDEETRARGLMFRTELAADAGMLFDFRREESVYFWMKNTYLPLDMIFIRSDGRIRSIARDATPLSEEPIGSGGPVRFVLEVAAGTAARLGIRPGDAVANARIDRHD
jgi:uncharacterized membrane protein (UPF0127 family)